MSEASFLVYSNFSLLMNTIDKGSASAIGSVYPIPNFPADIVLKLCDDAINYLKNVPLVARVSSTEGYNRNIPINAFEKQFNSKMKQHNTSTSLKLLKNLATKSYSISTMPDFPINTAVDRRNTLVGNDILPSLNKIDATADKKSSNDSSIISNLDNKKIAA
ncbi:hypothetical protein TRFO_41526 [Tritrichomonas foetus]|uniref:Uncharacterized protein n=1 Tax=Tritrichomonas foetus TaxID=1144522 RepID=A0A1J4L010_9EUKA|nr:hypothetical protein TRFO_41526 [Tritrichomonas foetus]|eukprot:OHT16849.1 hypothetical protein TRFO_41526 [Tritrichomonas foetus]